MPLNNKQVAPPFCDVVTVTFLSCKCPATTRVVVLSLFVYHCCTFVCCCHVLSCLVTISITVTFSLICHLCFVAHYHLYFSQSCFFVWICRCSSVGNSNTVLSPSCRCLVLISLSSHLCLVVVYFMSRCFLYFTARQTISTAIMQGIFLYQVYTNLAYVPSTIEGYYPFSVTLEMWLCTITFLLG